ncbi:MAG: prepilin peptidase [Melioribacteraceae bacterium]
MAAELIIFITGLTFGSFGNNIISHFINNQKFDLGRSHCFCGEKKLNLFEIIPIASFLSQRGKCNKCDKRISIRYFIVEFFTGLLAIILYLKFGLTFLFISNFFAFYIMFLIAVIDFLKFIIPNLLLGILLLITIINLIYLQDEILLKIILSVGMVIIFFSINLFYSKFRSMDAIGYGDIKYIGIILLLFSFPISLVGLWLSAFITLPGFYLLKYISRFHRYEQKIPFGTFISLGYFLLMLTDDSLINIYKHYFMSI